MTNKSTVLSPEALDFAPGLLAIQESPPAKLPRAVMYTVSSLFLILVVWAIFGKLTIVASAEGRLIPQTYVKIVQPAEAGIIKDILVKEGEKVQAGQVLMRMDMKLAEADSKTIGNDLGMRSLQLRRIDAELSGKPLLKKREDSDDLFRQVSAQYREHQQSHRDVLGQAQEALKRSQREYDSAREVLSKLEQTTPILKQQADAYAEMGKDGYIPLVTVRDKHREYLEKSQDQQAQKSTVASLEAAVNQAQKQLDQVTSKYRSDLQNERMEAEGQHRRLQQDWVKQEYKNGLMELKASQAGIVKDFATHTTGTVVSPGTVLLSIVPENEPLVAEVMVKNDDVGFVHLNQKVKLKLAAYPFERYGMLDGVVTHIGPDSTEADLNGRQAQDKQQAQTSNYKAHIELETQTLNSEGRKMKLVPGMQVVAEINQGSRTVLKYLISPVTKTLDESGHER